MVIYRYFKLCIEFFNPLTFLFTKKGINTNTSDPFWAERLGKTKMQAFQASQRGGELTVELQGDRVLLTGKAVAVLKGELYV